MTWGLTLKEIRGLSFSSYQKLYLANLYKESYAMARDRRLEATIMNFGGMGTKKPITPLEVMEIALIDKDDITLPITTIEQAKRIAKDIINENREL